LFPKSGCGAAGFFVWRKELLFLARNERASDRPNTFALFQAR
jgi:hypothetical protein